MVGKVQSMNSAVASAAEACQIAQYSLAAANQGHDVMSMIGMCATVAATPSISI
jgi:hypothetical protein